MCSHLTLEALRVEISVQSSDPGSFGLAFLWHDGFAAHGALGREHLGVALGAVDLLLVLAGGEGLAHQAPAARLAPEAGGVEAADQSEVSLWSRDPLSANHSSPAAPGLDVLALRGLAAPGAGVPHVGRVAVLQYTNIVEKGANGISR